MANLVLCVQRMILIGITSGMSTVWRTWRLEQFVSFTYCLLSYRPVHSFHVPRSVRSVRLTLTPHSFISIHFPFCFNTYTITCSVCCPLCPFLKVCVSFRIILHLSTFKSLNFCLISLLSYLRYHQVHNPVLSSHYNI